MLSACNEEHGIELLEQIFRASFLVSQLFPLGFRNLSTNTIVVKARKQFLFAPADIHLMNNNAVAREKASWELLERTDLNVLQAFVPRITAGGGNQFGD